MGSCDWYKKTLGGIESMVGLVNQHENGDGNNLHEIAMFAICQAAEVARLNFQSERIISALNGAVETRDAARAQFDALLERARSAEAERDAARQECIGLRGCLDVRDDKVRQLDECVNAAKVEAAEARRRETETIATLKAEADRAKEELRTFTAEVFCAAEGIERDPDLHIAQSAALDSIDRLWRRVPTGGDK